MKKSCFISILSKYQSMKFILRVDNKFNLIWTDCWILEFLDIGIGYSNVIYIGTQMVAIGSDSRLPFPQKQRRQFNFSGYFTLPHFGSFIVLLSGTNSWPLPITDVVYEQPLHCCYTRTEKDKKNLIFLSGDLNPGFSVFFPLMIWIFM